VISRSRVPKRFDFFFSWKEKLGSALHRKFDMVLEYSKSEDQKKRKANSRDEFF